MLEERAHPFFGIGITGQADPELLGCRNIRAAKDGAATYMQLRCACSPAISPTYAREMILITT